MRAWRHRSPPTAVHSRTASASRRATSRATAGPGGEPRVKVFDRTGTQLASFLAFDPSFHGGVRVAAGDLDGDGKAEIVVGTGPGDPATVRVFTGSGTLLRTIYPF